MDNEFVKKNFGDFVSRIRAEKPGDLSEPEIGRLLALFGLRPDCETAFGYSNCAFNLVFNPLMQIVYASNGYESLTGFTVEELGQNNMMFFLSRIHPDDIILQNKVMMLENSLKQQTDPLLLNMSKITFNYRFIKKDGMVTMLLNTIHHYFQPGNTEPEYSLTLTQDISHLKSGNSVRFEFSLYDEDCRNHRIVHTEEFFHQTLFTEKELEIIRSSSTGFTNKQRAHKNNLSEQTVKNYKYQMFRKANVKNMVELILFAKDKGLF
jgi:DNA-binding CsgD family transcriptional regulator